MQQNLIRGLALGLVTFTLSAGASYGLVRYLYPTATTPDSSPIASTLPAGGKLNIDASTPRSAPCPINGQLYTETERKIWETRRPLITMIENSPDARPQSGLNSADVLYEAVAEGGVTRFAAIYYCEAAHADVLLAPVRSARTHFIFLASEYNRPIYQHVGGANCDGYSSSTCPTDLRVRALEQLDSFGWKLENDLDARAVGLPVFKRDYSRLGADKELATEHTMTSTTETVFQFMKDKRGWTNLSPKKEDWKTKFVPYTFKDDAKAADRGTVSKISFGFWTNTNLFDVVWNYKADDNSYLRETGGAPHLDLNDNSQLNAKVVVVQLTKEIASVDPLKHVYYEIVGSGDAIVFQDGQAIKATWSKKDRESRTQYLDSKGKKITFNKGKMVVEIVPKGNTITY